ncbi:daptide biosynthesis intramembrane metalloprotease [Arthrobacter sp. fls2-241-R2A-200]|uniref:daptide biosynthesis intramembrane metalloprotease n=1 Tax=Arthrobacter sp. fls2-241-R2A-200 TaxID=3040281 RepID=UPI002550CC9B|nr:daptide biosynthesis intramembrane metalloprotease [Arthrobacter sp. fls2-241-R2A-200]
MKAAKNGRTAERAKFGAAQWPVQLASAASIDEPLQDGGPWIVSINSVPKARVSADVAAVLKAVDGRKDPAHVAQQLGQPWTAADVMGVVRHLAHTGIFDVGARQGTTRRLQFKAPLTLQLTLFNPAPFLQFLRPGAAALIRPSSAVLLGALLCGGIVGAAGASQSIWRVLSEPLPLEAYLMVAVAMFVSTLLHELGHGMALTYFGGTPRRIGIMLFYFSPAFFCDVTDGWRLHSRRQRVLVALAGPFVHLLLGSVALAGQALLAASSAKDATILYGAICYAVAILNLFPFIKLDGYVALMSAVDIPHLRQKSVEALAELVSHRVLGSAPSFRSKGILPWFGLASFISGIAFMVVGFQRLVPIFLQLGLAGYVAVFLALGLMVVQVVKAAARFFLSAARQGSPRWRRWGVLAGTLAVGALLLLIPVKPETVAGYTVVHGELRIVVPLEASNQHLDAGDHVALQSQGMIIHRNLGTATVGDQPPSNSTAPLETVVPVHFGRTSLAVAAYPGILTNAANLPASGRAVVESQRQTTLAQWLWETAADSPLWPRTGQTHQPTKGQP